MFFMKEDILYFRIKHINIRQHRKIYNKRKVQFKEAADTYRNRTSKHILLTTINSILPSADS